MGVRCFFLMFAIFSGGSLDFPDVRRIFKIFVGFASGFLVCFLAFRIFVGFSKKIQMPAGCSIGFGRTFAGLSGFSSDFLDVPGFRRIVFGIHRH